MATQLRNALTVWFIVVILISLGGSYFLHGTSYAWTIGLIRFGRLLWLCLAVVVAFDLILWLAHFTWGDDEPNRAGGPGSWLSAWPQCRSSSGDSAQLPCIRTGTSGNTSRAARLSPCGNLPPDIRNFPSRRNMSAE